jgi:cellulose synthase/poly-beta-1,6-N-acetylglucosamine synthase-like glycosyltransferase
LGNSPTVVVLIPTLNNARDLERCLAALGKQSYRPFTVWVADSDSRDDTPAIAARYGARYCNTATSTRADACNAALAELDCDIVVFTDDDCFPPPEWLGALVGNFLRPEVAGVGGPNVAPPDQAFWGRAADVAISSRWFTAGTRYGKQGGRVEEISHNSGCNAAYRLEVLRQAGGFNAGSIGGEDVDLDFRIRERGHRLWYDPQALTFHRRRESLRSLLRMGRSYGRGRAHVNAQHPPLSHPAHKLPAIGLVAYPLLTLASVLAAIAVRVTRPEWSLGWSLGFAAVPVLAALLYYVVGLIGAATGSSPYRSWGTIVAAPCCQAALHLGYGQGYLRGRRESVRRQLDRDEGIGRGLKARGR